MHKKFKISLFILAAFIISVFSSMVVNKAIASKSHVDDSVKLVLDTLSYKDVLPKNFRKTTDLTLVKDSISLNLKGLNKLNISGSEQFSEYNLPNLIKAIGTTLQITVVDLRQESHGLINGLPVSWADSKNNANLGLTREQVLKDEFNKLRSIKLNEPISFYNKPNEPIIPAKVQDENILVKSKILEYNRITVTDGTIPSDDMVDYFIQAVKDQPQNSWLHFHCKEGTGRTTTFMIMYDIMKNYKDASAEDIIKRQLALANFNESTLKSFNSNERIDFLKRFYNYCNANGKSFNLNWSQWKKELLNKTEAAPLN